MSVQAICLQRLWHTEPIEHAADAVNAEAQNGPSPYLLTS